MPKKLMETRYDPSRSLFYLSSQRNGRARLKKRGKSRPKEPRSINPNKLDSLSWLHRSNGKGIEYMIALKAEASSK